MNFGQHEAVAVVAGFLVDDSGSCTQRPLFPGVSLQPAQSRCPCTPALPLEAPMAALRPVVSPLHR